MVALKIYLGVCCVYFAAWAFLYWHMHKCEGLGINMLDNSSPWRFMIVIIVIFLTIPISMTLVMFSKTFQNFCLNLMDDEIYIIDKEEEENDEVSE